MKKILLLLIALFAINFSKANANFEDDLKELFPSIQDHVIKLYENNTEDSFDLIKLIKENLFEKDLYGGSTYCLFDFFRKISYDFTYISKSYIQKIILNHKEKKLVTRILINEIFSDLVIKASGIDYQIIKNPPQNPEHLLNSINQLKYLIENSTLNEEGTFLIPSEESNITPLEIYNEFATSLKKYSSNPKENIPFFADLALLHLKTFMQKRNFFKTLNIKYIVVFGDFVQEILNAYRLRKANYKWFLSINKKMLFLDYIGAILTKSHANTSFDTFLFSYYNSITPDNIINQIHTQKKFNKSINAYGNTYTQKRCSLKSQIELYPYILFIHFPFDLSKYDLIKMLNIDLFFWPLGFSFDKIIADSVTMAPSIFAIHDEQHFSLLHNMATISFMIDESFNHNHAINPAFINELKNHIKEGIALFVEWHSILKNICNHTADSTLKEYYSFFMFIMIHENRYGLNKRLLHIINKADFIDLLLNELDKALFNKKYYLPLLPKEIQEIDDTQTRKDILTKKINLFFDEMNSINTHKLIMHTENWMMTYNQFAQYKEFFISFDPLAYKIDINPSIIEKINDIELYTYHIKEPQQTEDDITGDNFSFKENDLVKSYNSLFRNGIEKEKIIYRYVFNSILPDGQEIETEDPFWIEKFIVSPKD